MSARDRKSIDWPYWRLLGKAKPTEAVALSLGIDPTSMERRKSAWMVADVLAPGEPFFTKKSFLGSKEESEYARRFRLLDVAFVPRSADFGAYSSHDSVYLAGFAQWCVDSGLPVPPEFAAMGSERPDSGSAANAEEIQPAGAANSSASGTSADQELADLFDPVSVEELETMFPTNGRWKKWAEKAHVNGLAQARVGRARFNPYWAVLWMLRNHPQKDVTLERCHRKLAKNLPARSKGLATLLTGEID